MINWIFCQNNSDKILFEGITKLKNSVASNWREINIACSGNYLIVNKNKPYYLGEAKNLKKRLRSQFTPTRSTFYKTYTKKIGGNLQIEGFKVSTIKTSIGRKETEEFGIVNLPTILNKFQLDKRNKISFSNIENIWEEVQNQYEVLLYQGESWFSKQSIVKWFNASIPILAGVYAVFDSSQKLIYIGESSDINKRHMVHSGRTYFSALRRHIGTDIFGFEFIDSKKRRFTEENDVLITDFLKTCSIKFATVNFGRFELEEYLIKKYNPALNRKDNN